MSRDEALVFIEKLIELAKARGVAGLEVQLGPLKVEFGFVRPDDKPKEKTDGG